MTSEQEQVPPTSAAPGWYPDVNVPGTQRYWDGAKWTDNIAPLATATPTLPQESQSAKLVTAVAPIVGLVGLIMSAQSTSVLEGTGMIWFGFALAAIAGVVARATAGVSTWARVICGILAALALVSAITTQGAVDDRRDDIVNDLSDFGSSY